MSTQTELPAASSASYPPDFSSVAGQVLNRLLRNDYPEVSLDPANTWLVSYTATETGEREFLSSTPLHDSLLDYFLEHLSFTAGVYFGLFRSAQSVAESDRIPLSSAQVTHLYTTFKDALEQAYRQALADYWNVVQPDGKTRRSLFNAERKKALLLESQVGVERNLLTTTQYAMLASALEHAPGNTQKHEVFHLALQHGQARPMEFAGAFVLVHTAGHEAPSLADQSLGEVLLHTANRGPEGFASLADMAQSLKLRLNSTVHKQVLLHNLANAHSERLLAADAAPYQWCLSPLSGNVLQAQLDQQVARQQADFSHLLGQARRSAMPVVQFLTTVLDVLQQHAQFDNAFVLDRNDRQLIRSLTPSWWIEAEHEHQQKWVRAARQYASAIITLHLLSDKHPSEPQAIAARNSRWLGNARQLMLAQMQMGLARAAAEPVPAISATVQAWIKAVTDSPEAVHRGKIDNQAIWIEFVTLDNQKLPDVLRIRPALARPNDPLLICTLNAPDNQVFRWFPGAADMREQFIDHPFFARYLLGQLPDEKRPVAWHDVQYALWIKHQHAPDAFSHLPPPRPLPILTFGDLSFAGPEQDFLQASHDLKLALFEAPRASASIGSFLAETAVNLVPFFLPAPLLIPLALGAGLLKVWEGFREVGEHDYKGAAHEFLSAVGYMAAAAAGAFLLRRMPFASLESVRSAPPLVRRIGPGGVERIGYLLSPSSAPRLADLDAVLPYDANKFRNINIDGEHYFVKTYSNLFGHRQLYRPDLFKPDQLVSEGDYAVQGSTGVWRKLLSGPTRTDSWVFKQARRELGELTATWPRTVEQIRASERSAFEADYNAMARSSNVEGFPHILEYCEAGSANVNIALRNKQSTASTQRFLADFYRLHEYRSMAFRACNVSTEGLQRLQNGVGLVFSDLGIQSASVSRWGAQQWSLDTFVTQHASPRTEAVFLIFDTTLPKKNLFSGFLGDHVAIAPNTPMQLMASRTEGQQVYLYFSRARHIPAKLYDLYSGVEELML